MYGDPKAYRAAMDANGISMPSGHMGLNDIEDDFEATLGVAKTLGNRLVSVAPYLEEQDRPEHTCWVYQAGTPSKCSRKTIRRTWNLIWLAQPRF